MLGETVGHLAVTVSFVSQSISLVFAGANPSELHFSVKHAKSHPGTVATPSAPAGENYLGYGQKKKIKGPGAVRAHGH